MASSQHSQPPQNAAYNVSGNPTDQTPREDATSRLKDDRGIGAQVETREQGDIPIPSTHGGQGAPSSLGYGTRTGDGDIMDGETGLANTESEKMHVYGEGEVAEAQHNKAQRGGFGEQEDLASDLDRKKAEQAPLREAMAESREAEIDVGGALGQSGGPAVVEGR